MKKMQTQLKSVAKSLGDLAKKVEKLMGELEKVKAPAAKPAKKAKAAPKKAKKAAAKKAKPAKKAAKKAVKKVAKKAAKARAKKAPKAPAAATAADKGTVLDSVLDVIKKAKNGASIATLKSKTKLEARQLSNALYKLTKKGAIEAKSRGVYFKK